MSAIAEGNEDGPVPIIQVLFALHPKFGAQELCGPVEVLSKALQKTNDPSMQEPALRGKLLWLTRCSRQAVKRSNVPLRPPLRA